MDKTFEENIRRVEWAIEAAKSVASKSDGWEAVNRVESIQLYFSGYAEPGYTDPESGIIAAGDWNKVSRWDAENNSYITVDDTMPRLAEIFESMGVEIEWCDQWISCDECSKIARTDPDGYEWSPSFVYIDGHVCLECIDPEEHLLSLEDSPGAFNSIRSIDPEDHEYNLVCDDFESGFHKGQDASPQKIAAIMQEAGFERFIFNIEGKGQFDVRFGLYLHDEESGDGELERAKHLIRHGNTNGPSNSDALRNALMDANAKANEIRANSSSPPGIIVANVSDGSASVKEVSVKDFYEGKGFDDV